MCNKEYHKKNFNYFFICSLDSIFSLSFLFVSFNTFLKYCDIGEEYYHEVIDSWRSPHIWRKLNGKWALRHPIWKEM